MNPIVLAFADGTLFFVGLAIVLVAELLLFRFHGRITRPSLTVLAITGIILVAVSATPLPGWAYALWGIPALAGLVLGNRPASSPRARLMASAALLAASVGLCLAELPFRSMPHISIKSDTTVYVVGDSISAGMRPKERCWPAVLGDMTHLRVVNLAEPGATVKSAATQVGRITETNALVLVAIGGNDLLGETDANTFGDQFERLISSLHLAHHQILIVELPLYPFTNAFGRAQRSTAARYGAALLPKRAFAQVLGMKGGTIDGLHLAQVGHNAMARTIAEVIRTEQ